MTKLAAFRRANLEKLAAYLESLPKSYRHFGMDQWIDSDSRAAEVRYAKQNGGVKSCGTSACAAGHGPAAGILVPPRYISRDYWGTSVDWSEYAEDLFVGYNPTLVAWLFSGSWNTIDNHHYGAAARIRYTLATGGFPDGFTHPARRWRKAYEVYRAASVDRSGEADETSTKIEGSAEGESAVTPKAADAQTEGPSS